MMITPPYLKPGDRVGIVCTARKLEMETIQEGVDKLKAWGLVPVVGDTIGKEDNQYGGTDAERTADLQRMLDDPMIKAVWCARGGYGTVRIIDKIDFYRFVKNPKWIAGYSDITVLHSHIHKIGIETLHSIMPSGIEDNSDEAVQSFKDGLFGQKISYTVDATDMNRNGNGTGEVVGGNISILYSLCGSPSDLNTDGKILFIEDLDEYLYHVDRMMMNLKRNGMLSNLNGLLVGGLTKMHDNTIPFGKNAKEIVWDAVKEYDFPVCFDFPAGHVDDNRTLIMGRQAGLEVSDDGVNLAFQD